MEFSADPKQCLKPAHFINSDDPSIRACVAGMALDGLSDSDKAVRLFNFVRDTITYEFGIRIAAEEYRASHVLEDGKGFCVRKSILLAALGRAAGIPSALILADMRDGSLSPRVIEALGSDIMYHHGMTAFYLNDQWLKVDSALSPELVQKRGYRPVEFDGKSDGLHENRTLSGDPHMEYVTIHGIYEDLPLEDALKAYATGYSNANPDLVKNMGLQSLSDIG